MFRPIVLALLFLQIPAVVFAADLPDVRQPQLQLDAGGPTAATIAMQFSPDGKTLYAAGADKVVRVWEVETNVWTSKPSIRVPIGAGGAGSINALALSPDGRWLAVGGRFPMDVDSQLNQGGLVVGKKGDFKPAQWGDCGTIYVFDLENHAAAKALRGHLGEVRALAFAPMREGQPPLFVSAAVERDTGEPFFGSVRLWDVEGGKALAVLSKKTGDLLPVPEQLEGPGLAVWRTGDGNKDVRVAIAWPEYAAAKGKMRLWDVALDKVRTEDCGTFNHTAAVLGLSDKGECRVVTGSVEMFKKGTRDRQERYPNGSLTIWHFSGKANQAPHPGEPIELLFDDTTKGRPLALTPVSSPDKEKSLELVATVIGPPRDVDRYKSVLELTDITNSRHLIHFNLERTRANIRPVIAAAPQGGWIAVAGFEDCAIEMYALKDLLAGKTKPVDRLRSKGTLFSHVRFIRRNKEAGLWLSEDPASKPLPSKPLPKGVVFSFEKRTLTDDTKDWELDTPSQDDWDFDSELMILSYKDKRFPNKVALEPGQEINRGAVLPPMGQDKGRLALAHTDKSSQVTYITLFDVASGKPLRRFVGHLERVRKLAFSNTYPLLVSVAEDQTVRVWSFADLNDGGGRPQGVDVRGPLLSLFVSLRDPDRKVDSEWIGWSPKGPFDVSSNKADAYIGWHVNTGEPANPATFLPAGANYKLFYKGDKGILKLLIEQGSVEKALGAIPRDPEPEPRLVASILGEKQERLDLLPLRGQKELRVTLDEKYPLDKLDKVQWRWRPTSADAVKGKFVDMKPVSGKDRSWSADLSQLEWKQGEYLIEVSFHSEKYGKDTLLSGGGLKVRYQPPAPHLSAVVEKRDLEPGQVRTTVVVTAAKVVIKVKVVPAPGQTAHVHFTPSGEKQKPRDRVVNREETLTEEFDLEEGSNNIDITAMNKGALAGHEQHETSELRATVQYKKPMAKAPPVIDALRVTSLPSNGFFAKDPESGKEVFVVDLPQIEVSSKVAAASPLRSVKWAVGKKEEDIKINPDGPTKVLKSVELKAGVPTELLLSAATGNAAPGEKTEVRLRVVYWPPLPAISILPPDRKDVYGDKVAISGEVAGPAASAKYDFDVDVIVENNKGEPKSFKGTVAKTKDKWSAEVLLPRGENEISVAVRNQWRRAAPVKLPKSLIYKQPPIFDKESPIEAKFKDKTKPFVSFTASVWLPSDTEISGATLNDEPLHANKFKAESTGKTKRDMKDMKEWKVTVDDVPVKAEGKWLTKLDLNVKNADGFSREPVTIKITRGPKDFPPPQVEWSTKNQQDSTQELEYKIEFHVKSESQLTKLEVLRNGQRALTPKLAMNKLNFSETVTLEWGTNELQIVAVNADGGESRSDVLVVPAVQAPVRVVIDHLEIKDPRDGSDKKVEPRKSVADQVQFDAVAHGLCYVHGHVEWTDSRDEHITKENLQITAFANGARQLPMQLKEATKAKPNQRGFEGLIGLTRPKNNLIEIELPPELKSEKGGVKFSLDCKEPVNDQRLHVLVVGVKVQDREKLKSQVLSVLSSSPASETKDKSGIILFKADAFKTAWLYEVLCGDYVNKDDVNEKLRDIKSRIEQKQEEDRQNNSWQNDVVFVYFQGSEGIDPDNKQRYLKMSLNEESPEWKLSEVGLPYDDLLGNVNMPGVQLIVLNVPRTPQDRAVPTSSPRRQAVMRYVNPSKDDTKSPESTVLTGLKVAAENLKEKKDKRGTLGNLLDLADPKLKEKGIEPFRTGLDSNVLDLLLIKPKPS